MATEDGVGGGSDQTDLGIEAYESVGDADASGSGSATSSASATSSSLNADGQAQAQMSSPPDTTGGPVLLGGGTQSIPSVDVNLAVTAPTQFLITGSLGANASGGVNTNPDAPANTVSEFGDTQLIIKIPDQELVVMDWEAAVATNPSSYYYGFPPSVTIDQTLTLGTSGSTINYDVSAAGQDYAWAGLYGESPPYGYIAEGSGSSSFDVTMTAEFAHLAGSFTGTLPQSANLSDTLSPALQISNSGPGEASGDEVTNYYLSTTPDLTGTTTLLESNDYPLDIASGGSLTESQEVTVPSDQPGGTYYLVAQINATGGVGEGAGDDDIVASGPILIPPDLTGEFTGPMDSIPSTAAPGETISPELQITDAADAAAVVNGAETTAYYLSTTPNLTGILSPALAVNDYNLNLDAGDTYTESQDVTIPVGVTPGAYYLVAQVDANQTINPNDTDNFAGSDPIQVSDPDLTGEFAGSIPDTAEPGDTISPELQITDDADAAPVVDGEETTVYCLSTTPDLAGILSPALAINDYSLSLDAGDTYTEFQDVTVPDTAGPGTYYLVAQIDANQTINPADTDNFAASDPIVVPATPLVTWAHPAAITYGTPLSGTQLDAQANVPGTFDYTPLAGTVLNAGSNQTLSVEFTPTDTTDYNDVDAAVPITVTKAPLTVTANNANRAAGAANPTLTDTITGFVHGDTESVVSGSPSLATTAIPASPPGNYTISAAIGTLSAANYSFATFNDGSLTITGLRLTTPASAVSVNVGSSYAVDWTGGNPTDTLQLWAEGGPNNAWIELTAGVPESNGSFTWNTTGVLHGWYYFQAWDIPASGTAYAVQSPNYLHVVNPSVTHAPTVTLTNPPLAGAHVSQGTSYTVNWTTTEQNTDTNPLFVQLWVHNGTTNAWSILPTANSIATGSSGSYVWNTTNVTPGWYSFTTHITDGDLWGVGGPNANSPGWVEITVPTPTITYLTPTSGQSTAAGGSFNLNWSISGLSSSDISSSTVQLWAQYLSNGTAVWTEIAASVDAANGTYTWTVPTSPGNGTYYAFSMWMNYGNDWWIQASPNWVHVT